MSDNTKIFLGFATGLLAGVVAGILLAPDKGDKTRKLIADKALEQLNPSLEKANELAKSLGNTISETINDYSHKIFKKAEKVADKGEES